MGVELQGEAGSAWGSGVRKQLGHLQKLHLYSSCSKRSSMVEKRMPHEYLVHGQAVSPEFNF